MGEDKRLSSRGEDDTVAALLRRAGRRPEVPDQVMKAAERAAKNQWRGTLRRQQRRRRSRWAAGLAAVAAALLLVVDPMGWRSGIKTQVAVAQVESVSGQLFSLSEQQEISVGAVFNTNTEIETRVGASGGGRAALRLAGGVSLRLDQGTRVALVSATELELKSGAVYVDTGDLPAADDHTLITIHSRWGAVRDIGTRFETRIDGDELKIRVRDGEVELADGDFNHRVPAGQELVVDRRGEVSAGPIAGHGDLWAWTLEALPGFEIEGKTLDDFLHWAARELGRELRFSDPTTQAQAQRLTLHGSIAGLDLVQAVELTLLGSGLNVAFLLEDGELVIAATGSS